VKNSAMKLSHLDKLKNQSNSRRVKQFELWNPDTARSIGKSAHTYIDKGQVCLPFIFLSVMVPHIPKTNHERFAVFYNNFKLLFVQWKLSAFPGKLRQN